MNGELNIWAENGYTEQKKNLNNKTLLEFYDTITKIKKNAMLGGCNFTGKISGIYIILNKLNNKYYVGSSSDILIESFGRWYKHIWNLHYNKHHCAHLQFAWNKYGSDTFEFHIVELINRSQNISVKDFKKKLTEIEQKYLDWGFSHINIFYNVSKSSIGSDGFLGKHHTNEWKKHMSEIIKMKIRTKEHCENISKAKRGMPNLKCRGRKLSNEHRKKISENHHNVTGKNNPMFGKHHSTETRYKISKKHRGMNHFNCDKNKYKFYNKKLNLQKECTRIEMCNEFGIYNSNMCMLINKKIKSIKGWTIV